MNKPKLYREGSRLIVRYYRHPGDHYPKFELSALTHGGWVLRHFNCDDQPALAFDEYGSMREAEKCEFLSHYEIEDHP